MPFEQFTHVRKSRTKLSNLIQTTQSNLNVREGYVIFADNGKYPFTISVVRNIDYNLNQQKKWLDAFILGLR